MSISIIKNRLKTLETNAPAFIKKRRAEKKQYAESIPIDGSLQWHEEGQPENKMPGSFIRFGFSGRNLSARTFRRYNGVEWLSISFDEFMQQLDRNEEGKTRWAFTRDSIDEHLIKLLKCTSVEEWPNYTEYPIGDIEFEQFTAGQWVEISETEYNESSSHE